MDKELVAVLLCPMIKKSFNLLFRFIIDDHRFWASEHPSGELGVIILMVCLKH